MKEIYVVVYEGIESGGLGAYVTNCADPEGARKRHLKMLEVHRYHRGEKHGAFHRVPEASLLSRCPFCGCTPAVLFSPSQQGEPDMWRIECGACLATSRRYEDRAAAIGAWNRRIGQCTST
jgi:Lar family restriction alleviation protein